MRAPEGRFALNRPGHGRRRRGGPSPPRGARHGRPRRPSTGRAPGSEPGRPPPKRRPLPAGPVGKQGGRSREAAGAAAGYLSPGSASSPAGRTEERAVPLEEDGPTQGSTIPPRAPSLRHCSHRNHRSGGASSSPPLGDGPSAAGEHAQSPQSRGSPGRPALPAINRSQLQGPAPGRCPLPRMPRPQGWGPPSPGPTPRPSSPASLSTASPTPAPAEISRFVGSLRLPIPVPARTGDLRQ